MTTTTTGFAIRNGNGRDVTEMEHKYNARMQLVLCDVTDEDAARRLAQDCANKCGCVVFLTYYFDNKAEECEKFVSAH